MLGCIKFFTLTLSFLICTFSASLFSAPQISSQTIPSIDLQKEFKNGKASLAGE
ncbi:MAG: hypothetical protein ACI9UT_001219, partial [Flavobacteriales bacterium]